MGDFCIKNHKKSKWYCMDEKVIPCIRINVAENSYTPYP